ncbi:hypothetical protein [Micromonospora sp. NPDC050695]|uniref:type II secretion system F family protein n=1 Tax=unclassified Micromonospora TaxID=2617518 RepID=UPI0033D07B50
MTGGSVLVAVLLLGAAVLVAWPVRTIRARRRRVLAAGPGTVVDDPDDALVQWVRELGRTPDGPEERSTQAAISKYPPAAESAGGQAPAARSDRDTIGVASWVGSRRPAGPARPPTRRDPRRPAGTDRPGAVALDAEPRAGASVATSTFDGGEPEAHGPGDTSGGDGRRAVHADGPGRVAGAATVPRGDVDRRDQQLVDPDGREDGGFAAVRGVRSARVLLLAGLVGAGVGAVIGGPVAGVALAGYGTLVVRGLVRRRANRRAERIRRRGLDQLCGLAADLRAGVPVPPVIEVASAGGSDRLRQLTSAAVRLADRTGAPLAELVERIEADARATDRGLAAAAAQAAGARATAWLLAALPVGGIGLGYAIGVDPVAVLLHSTVGGVCAVLAVALQVVGLFWAERLGSTPGRPA